MFYAFSDYAEDNNDIYKLYSYIITDVEKINRRHRALLYNIYIHIMMYIHTRIMFYLLFNAQYAPRESVSSSPYVYIYYIITMLYVFI